MPLPSSATVISALNRCMTAGTHMQGELTRTRRACQLGQSCMLSRAVPLAVIHNLHAPHFPVPPIHGQEGSPTIPVQFSQHQQHKPIIQGGPVAHSCVLLLGGCGTVAAWKISGPQLKSKCMLTALFLYLSSTRSKHILVSITHVWVSHLLQHVWGWVYVMIWFKVQR